MKETEPTLIQRRPCDWPYATHGWTTVGGGKNAPGHASERSAKIELAKNPEWKERNPTILPFRWNDGGLRGCSPYWETKVRYAIVVEALERKL